VLQTKFNLSSTVKNEFFFLFNNICSDKFLRWFLSHPNGYSTCLATPGIFPGVDEILGVVTQLGTFWRIDEMIFRVTRHTPWRIEFN
jgi:hypothetical protein